MRQLKNKNSKPAIILEWDFGASPTWINGINVDIHEVVKDKEKVKEIEKWYKEFSVAEETLHHRDLGKKMSKSQLKNTIKHMQEKLVPWGQKLACDIDAELHVDWGHDPEVEKLVRSITKK
jgi:hypothetical protein